MREAKLDNKGPPLLADTWTEIGKRLPVVAVQFWITLTMVHCMGPDLNCTKLPPMEYMHYCKIRMWQNRLVSLTLSSMKTQIHLMAHNVSSC